MSMGQAKPVDRTASEMKRKCFKKEVINIVSNVSWIFVDKSWKKKWDSLI